MSGREILPETRVAQLLDAHPELEEELIAAAPRFAALRNPVLRRTVARVTTLAQAAAVAGIPARELVDRLRAAAGQPALAGDAAELALQPPPPAVAGVEPAAVVDAGALLAAGSTPVAEVTRELDACPPGGVVRVEAPFLPAPMVEALRRRGAAVWGRENPGGTWTLWVRPGGRPG